MKENTYDRVDYLVLGCGTSFIILILLWIHAISSGGEIFLGIFSGVFASFFTLLTEEIIKRIKLKHYLKNLNGIWQGGTYENREFVEHSNDQEKWFSMAEIKYRKDNLLEIIMTENDSNPKSRKWRGTMEINEKALRTGTITYKYTDNLEAGYRQVLIESDDDCDYIFIFPITNRIYTIKGESPKYDYGIEILRRRKELI